MNKTAVSSPKEEENLRLERTNKLLKDYCRQIWKEIGEETQQLQILAAAKAWEQTGRSKKQLAKRRQGIHGPLRAYCSRVLTVSSRAAYLENFRQVLETYSLESLTQEQRRDQEEKVRRKAAGKAEWLWRTYWERSLYQFLRQVLEAEYACALGDRELARLCEDLESACREILADLRRDLIRAAVEEYSREKERQDALYKSWWRQMWAEYRHR